MTTIAYRDGILAADTRCLDAELEQKYYRVKIRKLADAVMAESGEDEAIERFVAWWRAGRPTPVPRIKRGDLGMIVVHPDLRVEIWLDCNFGMPMTDDPYCASGSGAKAALGCMWKGGTAREGIQAAMLHDPDTGGRITTVDVRKYFGLKPARR